MVRGASTLRFRTWGLPPYGALAGELNFGNKAVTPMRQFIAGRKSFGTGGQWPLPSLSPLIRLRICRDQPFEPRFFLNGQFE